MTRSESAEPAPRYRTEDGFTFYALPSGRVVDNLDPDLVDMSWETLADFLATTGAVRIESGEVVS